jgi:AhpD family alkylhydroperoxidase
MRLTARSDSHPRIARLRPSPPCDRHGWAPLAATRKYRPERHRPWCSRGSGEHRFRSAADRPVNFRVSQLNGRAFCLDMHSKDLRARGETERRLYMTSAWREVPHLYSDRERAALAWAEAVTRLEDQLVPDAVYDMASREFSEAELTQLTLAIVAINGWKRFNVAFHKGTVLGTNRNAATTGRGHLNMRGCGKRCTCWSTRRRTRGDDAPASDCTRLRIGGPQVTVSIPSTGRLGQVGAGLASGGAS